MWVLVGIGNIKIPAMVFSTKESAITKCNEIFGTSGKMRWHDLTDDQVKKMYTRYYDGCGGCYDAELIEVVEGTPFVQWDLD